MEMPTNTLDFLLAHVLSPDHPWGEWMKLDTQGTEYEILQGAQQTLRDRTVAVVTEVSFFQSYAGQKLFSDLDVFLRALGFSFYGFTEIHYRSGKRLDKLQEAGRERIFWAEAVFLKDPLAGGFLQKPLSARHHYALFLCAVLLEYDDFALELLRPDLFSDRDRQTWAEFIHQHAQQSPETSRQEAMELVQRIEHHPERAAIEVGHFVDRRSLHLNYEDIE